MSAITAVGKFAVLTFAGCLLVGACSGAEDDRSIAGPSRSASSLTPSASVNAAERFAEVSVPGAAEDVRVWRDKNSSGPIYVVRFKLPARKASEFCANNDLGGTLPRLRKVTAEMRHDFRVRGKSAKTPQTCGGERIDPPGSKHHLAKREVLITFTKSGTAVVHLHVFAIPSR